MAKIIIQKDNDKKSFESLNATCLALGSKSGKNKETAIRFILSKGYEIIEGVSAVDIENAKAKKSRPQTSFVDRIKKKLAKVDNDKVNEIIERQQKLIKNMKSQSDIETLQKLNNDLDKARNPEVTKKDFLTFCENAWNDHHDQKENA